MLGFAPQWQKPFRLERKLALAVEQLVSDRAHAGRELEDHSVRAFEIEELGRGGGCRPDQRPSGPGGRSEVERAHDVVAGLDLMIDVLDAGAVGRKQRDVWCTSSMRSSGRVARCGR
jgi:hypothetical protein